MLDESGEIASFVFGLVVAGGLLALVTGGPRLLRSSNQWMGAVLFSSLDGWQRTAASLSAILAVFWSFLLVAGFYSPAAASAPETVPHVGPATRAVLAIDIWVLIVAIPLAFGLAEGLMTKRKGLALAQEVVRGLVYLPALALALAIIFPWTLWERARRMLRRDVQHFHRVFIEIDKYDPVLECIARRLNDQGLKVRAVPAPRAVRVSRWLADHVGPPAFRDRTPYVLHALVGEGVALTVYTSLLDLAVSKPAIGRARSALWGELPPDGFWWTTSGAARDLEASILGRYGELPEDVPAKLATLEGGADEWRALQQEYLMVTHIPAAQRAGA
jgi:hypothetical protein